MELPWDIYKTKSIDEVKMIKPKWACGKNISKILNPDLCPKSGCNTIFSVNVKDLVNHSDFHEVDMSALFNNEPSNDNRIAKIIYRWDKDEFVDPPSLYLNHESSTKLLFSDGRHRTKVAYLLEYQTIPIAILKSEIKEIGQIIRLTKI